MPIDNPISSTIPEKPDDVAPAMKTCHCGKVFVPRRGTGGYPQKYCSTQCRDKAHRQSENGKDRNRKYRQKYQQSEKYKLYKRKYRRSENGKDRNRKWQRKYQQSEKGKDCRRKYKRSEKSKQRNLRYAQSEKGKRSGRKYWRKESLRKRLAEVAQQLAIILGEPIT